jgi:hypothetical protein
MGSANYYRISALPALGDLGAPPPMGLAALREHVLGSARPLALVDAILLGDDLLQREAFLAGEIREVEPAVLAAAQARNEEPLPNFLATEEAAILASDAVWAAYFRHAAAVANRHASRFLAEWIAHEVALRNTLAAARAAALGLDPQDYLVASDLGGPDDDLRDLVREWSAAPDPLAGLRILDRARWAWLAEHDAWFSFADEELAAYAAKLVLVVRWHRLNNT